MLSTNGNNTEVLAYATDTQKRSVVKTSSFVATHILKYRFMCMMINIIVYYANNKLGSNIAWKLCLILSRYVMRCLLHIFIIYILFYLDCILLCISSTAR